MLPLTGRYQHNIDQQSRLFIPKKLCDKLGETFYAYLPLNGTRCILLFREEKLMEITEKLKQDFSGRELSEYRRQLYGNLEEVSPDKHGRISLRTDFCEWAQLEKEVLINGVNDMVEIWRKPEEEIQNEPNPALKDWEY